MANLSLLPFLVYPLFLSSFNCLSDLRLCLDDKCEQPISEVKALVDHITDDANLLTFNKGDQIIVHSKEAGTDRSLWGGTVNGRAGYFPHEFVTPLTDFSKETPEKLLPTLPFVVEEIVNKVFDPTEGDGIDEEEEVKSEDDDEDPTEEKEEETPGEEGGMLGGGKEEEKELEKGEEPKSQEDAPASMFTEDLNSLLEGINSGEAEEFDDVEGEGRDANAEATLNKVLQDGISVEDDDDVNDDETDENLNNEGKLDVSKEEKLRTEEEMLEDEENWKNEDFERNDRLLSEKLALERKQLLEQEKLRLLRQKELNALLKSSQNPPQQGLEDDEDIDEEDDEDLYEDDDDYYEDEYYGDDDDEFYDEMEEEEEAASLEEKEEAKKGGGEEGKSEAPVALGTLAEEVGKGKDVPEEKNVLEENELEAAEMKVEQGEEKTEPKEEKIPEMINENIEEKDEKVQSVEVTSEPDEKKEDPEAKKDDLEEKKNEPEATKDDPEEKKDEPEAKNVEPEEKKDEPEAMKDEMEEKKDEPEAKNVEPEEKKDEPEVMKDEMEEKNDEPEAKNVEAEEKKDEPEAMKDQPEEKKDEPELKEDEPEDIIQEEDEANKTNENNTELNEMIAELEKKKSDEVKEEDKNLQFGVKQENEGKDEEADQTADDDTEASEEMKQVGSDGTTTIISDGTTLLEYPGGAHIIQPTEAPVSDAPVVSETPELSSQSSQLEDILTTEPVVSASSLDQVTEKFNATAADVVADVVPSMDAYVSTGEFVSRKPLEALEDIVASTPVDEPSVAEEAPTQVPPSWNSGRTVEEMIEDEPYVPAPEDVGFFHWFDGCVGWLDEPLAAFVEKLPSSVKPMFAHEPFLGLSPPRAVLLAFVISWLCSFCLVGYCFSSGKRTTGRPSSKQSSAEVGKITEELFMANKENENLQRELDLAQKKLHNQALQDTIAAQQQQVMDVTGTMTLQQQQIEALSAQNSDLENKLYSAEDEMANVTESTERHREECLELHTKLEAVNEELSVMCTFKDKLFLETEKMNEREKENKAEMNQLSAQIDVLRSENQAKDSEIQSLRVMFTELEAINQALKLRQENEDESEESGVQRVIADMMDVSTAKAAMASAEEERSAMASELASIKERNSQLLSEIEEVNNEVEVAHTAQRTAVLRQQEAETKLKVLKEYYNEKELEMQKELGAQSLKEKYSSTELEKMGHESKMLTDEVLSSKRRVTDLEAEITKIDQSSRSLLREQEEKCHDNWLKYRESERKREALEKENFSMRELCAKWNEASWPHPSPRGPANAPPSLLVSTLTDGDCQTLLIISDPLVQDPYPLATPCTVDRIVCLLGQCTLTCDLLGRTSDRLSTHPAPTPWAPAPLPCIGGTPLSTEAPLPPWDATANPRIHNYSDATFHAILI
ncbi:hypothetical protein CAPTEDRAFT_225110 [Capitella teleta]|uniref:SH3 domain-containing protein n=1 Tax=Capitella teleta TaxID=283909 RepID=R7TFG5_CAPTE|nr:hypothetical protein CAPTEDRAFT_225110 [Capitella teleta]|eukprot:ELT90281.1 hypothetical protein CAPTEDRAFT_225110 [Capitella teleta]